MNLYGNNFFKGKNSAILLFLIIHGPKYSFLNKGTEVNCIKLKLQVQCTSLAVFSYMSSSFENR